jgi:hypothetical protein
MRAPLVFVVSLIVACAGPMGSAGQMPRAHGVAVRFHHLHYKVDDPGAALGEAASRLKGTRAIVQGIGVGVRIGREYVLFDRAAGEPGDASVRTRSAGDAYSEAVLWLTSHGVQTSPGSLAETSVPRGLSSAGFDHIAFAAADPHAVLAALAETPITRTDDVAAFRLPSGLVLEIVRDSDRPDTHWCPMHPDIRAPGDGTCPICRMALVPIPPPRIGEYRLDVTMAPRDGGGLSGLRLMVRDPDSGDRVSRFLDVHERPFHLFVVSRDLATFAHVHPEAHDDGTLVLTHELAPGEYMLIADFLPVGGTSQLVQRAIVTPGYSGPLFPPAPVLETLGSEQVVAGLRIQMEAASVVPRRPAQLRFTISDVDSGLPVMDLEPYLGAPGHLLVVSPDLTVAIHGHPDGGPTSGPVVTFDPVLPAPGRYKMWVQLQRKGEVITAPFIIEASELR